MRLTLTLQELETFVVVAKAKNFRLGAERSHISQPALSRRIQTAEGKLNTRLFDRNTRSVELTAAGELLLPIAKRILAEFRSSLIDLSEFVIGQKGNITIAALPSIAAALLPATMATYQKSHPFVTFSLLPFAADTVLQMVVDGSADFALSIDPLKPAVISYEPLIDDEFVLICARTDPLATRREAPWSIFAERPYIAAGSASSSRCISDRVFAETGISVTPRYESANVPVLGSMVAAQLGISAIPRLSLGLMNMSGIAVVPLTQPVKHREIGILSRKGRTLSMAAMVFLDTLRAQALGTVPTADVVQRLVARSAAPSAACQA